MLLVWFIVRSIQSMPAVRVSTSPTSLIHAVMSFAMLLMYWFPMGLTSGSGSMAMSGTAGGVHLDAGLGLLLALIFLASAIFTLASPNKGASHHGTHVPAYADERCLGVRSTVSPHGGPDDPPGMPRRSWPSPGWRIASHVVMCIGMGFMLILMI